MNIYQRMHAVMTDLTFVSKDRYNSFDKFNYTGHDDVTEALHPLFVTHGIVQIVSILDLTRRDDGSVAVDVSITWACATPAGTSEEPLAPAQPSAVTVKSFGEANATRKGKDGAFRGDDLQVGKAVSYAVKYAQLKNFCLVGGGVPDNERDAREEEPRGAEPEKQPEKAPENPITEEQMAKMLEAYGNVSEREHLNQMRKAVTNIMARLTKAQLSTLESVDRETQKRLASQKGTTT